MKLGAITLSVVACALAWPVARAEAQQVRVAVVVGNNIGREPARALRYAEEEVGKLARLLKTSGDFSHVQIVRGRARADVEQALRAARMQLDDARKAGKPTLFMFYYSGHGDNEALELGSSRLPLRDLRAYLEGLSQADVRLAFVDACHSGALTGVKGGRRAPAYEVRLADPGGVSGMAIITSSTANELSQESDDLRGSYFSANIMAGLQGLADSSRDGQVTLGELYDYASKRTLANTAATLAGGQHPTYVYRISGTGDVILTRTRTKDAQLAFPREAGVIYSVLHQGRNEVIAELSSSAAEDLYIALEAGEYRVVRRAMGSVREKKLTLAAGSSVSLEPSKMMPVMLLAQNNLRKKGPSAALRNAFGAHVGVQSSVVNGSSDYLGAAGLSYARSFGGSALRLRGDITSFDATVRDDRSSNLRISTALDLLLPIVAGEKFGFVVGPSVGVATIRQRRPDDSRAVTDGSIPANAVSYGLAYGGVASASFRTVGDTWLVLSATAGGELHLLNGVQTNRPTAALTLGGVFAF